MTTKTQRLERFRKLMRNVVQTQNEARAVKQQLTRTPLKDQSEHNVMDGVATSVITLGQESLVLGKTFIHEFHKEDDWLLSQEAENLLLCLQTKHILMTSMIS